METVELKVRGDASGVDAYPAGTCLHPPGLHLAGDGPA